MKNKLISVHNAFSEENLTDLFPFPLSQQAFLQLQLIQHSMQDRALIDDEDKWFYSWGAGSYALSKVYKILVGHSDIHPTF